MNRPRRFRSWPRTIRHLESFPRRQTFLRGATCLLLSWGWHIGTHHVRSPLRSIHPQWNKADASATAVVQPDGYKLYTSTTQPVAEKAANCLCHDQNVKAVESLTVVDLRATPVWQYANDDGAGETSVYSVVNVPVTNLTGKLIGTQVQLANGTKKWALIGNIDARDPRLTEHFLTLSFERDGRWFHLARYHDFDYADRGPEALSRFLGVPVDEIFPVSFDVRRYADGDPAVLKRSVLKEPRERLSRVEIIALAVP